MKFACIASIAFLLTVAASKLSAASLERAPFNGEPGIVRIFVSASEVSDYQAIGYQLVDYNPRAEILDVYLNSMCTPDPTDTEIANRFGVAPAHLCASAQAFVAESQ